MIKSKSNKTTMKILKRRSSSKLAAESSSSQHQQQKQQQSQVQSLPRTTSSLVEASEKQTQKKEEEGKDPPLLAAVGGFAASSTATTTANATTITNMRQVSSTTCCIPMASPSSSSSRHGGGGGEHTTIAVLKRHATTPLDTNTRTTSRSLSPGPSPLHRPPTTTATKMTTTTKTTKRHRRLASSPPDILSPTPTKNQSMGNKMTMSMSMQQMTPTPSWDLPQPCSSGEGASNYDDDNDDVGNVKYLQELQNMHQKQLEEEEEEEEDEESSIETQESEYLVDHSSKYTNSTNRLTCLVYKRKEGLSGKMKQSYAVASEKRKYIGHKVHLNIGSFPLGLVGWNSGGGGGTGKEFWKLGGKGHVVNPGTPHVNDVNACMASNNAPPLVKMWERRRLVLEGRLLMYYHEKAELEERDEEEQDENDDDDDDEEEDAKNVKQGQEDRHNIISGKGSSEKEDSEDENVHHDSKRREESGRSMSSGLHRWREKINELVEHAHLKSTSQAVINSPKGVIDLVASRATATVVPISQHSFAPTPYCLAILVKSEVKWMLCFEEEKEILKWLNVFTQIALKQSVERYSKKYGKEYQVQRYQYGHVATRGVSKEEEEKMHGHNDDVGNGNVINNGNLQYIGDGDDDGQLKGVQTLQSDTSLLSAMSMVDYDAYRIVALVNSAFLYLFLVVEEITTVSHIVAFLIVNMCTWFHIRYSCSKRSTAQQLPMDRILDKQCNSSSNVTVGRRNPPMSIISTEEEKALGENASKVGRHIVASSSFIERHKSVDSDDESNTYRPMAGSSTMQFRNPHESHLNAENEEMVAWIAANPSIIHLRGDDYLISKKKVPAATSLYELVELDAFDSHEHMTDVGQKFRFSPQDFGSSGNWCAPDTLIISFALPTTAPKLGRSSSDGKGYIVCGYYRIRSEVRNVLEIISNPDIDTNERRRQIHLLFPDAKQRSIVNGIKLWEKWCRTSATDPEMQKRLKFIPRGENLNELGVPSWICRYNGKPMLIKRPGETSFIFSHPDDRTLEIDVNLHPLPFMFKQAMAYLKEHYFSRMLMTFGFVIEGREDDELPEVLLGNPIQLPFNNPNAVMKAEALFSGDDTASF
jgi:Protein of unknown function (DUF1336).